MASLEFIRLFVQTTKKPARYVPNGMTRCPICEFCGLKHGKVLVRTVIKGIRYMSCEVCTCTFPAIADDEDDAPRTRKKGARRTKKRAQRQAKNKEKKKAGKLTQQMTINHK